MRQILYLKIVFLIGKYTKKSPKREENYYESFKINIYYTKSVRVCVILLLGLLDYNSNTNNDVSNFFL